MNRIPFPPVKATPPIRSAIVALLGMSVIGGVLGMGPAGWVVEHVEWEGTHRAEHAGLRHLADLRNGQYVWQVDLDRVARNVERHPWVQRATARRVWPDTIRVEVEEFEPYALLHLDSVYYVDRSGNAFLRGVTDGLDYPNITGISPALGRAHPDLPRLAVQDVLWLLETLEDEGIVSVSQVSEVAFGATRGWTVHAGVLQLVFGFEDLPRQVRRLKALIEAGEVDVRRPTFVDLAPVTVAIVRPLSIRSGGS